MCRFLYRMATRLEGQSTLSVWCANRAPLTDGQMKERCFTARFLIRRGAQINGASSLRLLNFVWWFLIVVDPQYRTSCNISVACDFEVVSIFL